MRLALPAAALAARAALVAALAACQALPIPVAAQSMARPITLEPYVSRARLAPAVVGDRTRLSGVGARLLFPPGDPASRLRLGGFVTYAPVDAFDARAAHFGALADYALRPRPLAGRVEPLLSLGAGAFQTSGVAAAERVPGPSCVRALDAPRAAPVCFTSGGGEGAARRRRVTHAALSPAVAARVALGPGLALRVDVRDVAVLQRRPRHMLEITTGLSLTR